jgi:two-component system sensor kinase FixL
MSDVNDHNNTGPPIQGTASLRAENEHLRQENLRLLRQTQDVAAANAHAAELMVQLEEANEHLLAEIERRKAAEDRLSQINRRIETTVQERTAELSAANQRLTKEISQREKMEQSLREHKVRLDAIFSAILTGIVIVDRHTHQIVDVNPQAARTIGLPREEIIGKVCHRFICPAGTGRCPIGDLGQTIDQSERVLLTAAGEKVPILKTVVPASWQQHDYLVESFVDISDRKKMEDQRSLLLGQLEKANAELKDFAYVVSHDLKAPLRGIKTLAEWLAADYAGKLDEAGREQISLLVGRAERMHNLIDGILRYSRAGRTEEQEVAVPLDKLLAEILDAIAPPENVVITIEGALPTVQGEVARVTQVFQNLISNAVKYLDKPQGQIRIGCVEDGEFWRFSVSDNGPGIEDKHFEKIFRLFQTLSSKDNYESTGVGLAIVKKIVEMYGGRIWVESQVGEGSTFLFTWPKSRENAARERPQTGVACQA